MKRRFCILNTNNLTFFSQKLLAVASVSVTDAVVASSVASVHEAVFAACTGISARAVEGAGVDVVPQLVDFIQYIDSKFGKNGIPTLKCLSVARDSEHIGTVLTERSQEKLQQKPGPVERDKVGFQSADSLYVSVREQVDNLGIFLFANIKCALKREHISYFEVENMCLNLAVVRKGDSSYGFVLTMNGGPLKRFKDKKIIEGVVQRVFLDLNFDHTLFFVDKFKNHRHAEQRALTVDMPGSGSHTVLYGINSHRGFCETNALANGVGAMCRTRTDYPISFVIVSPQDAPVSKQGSGQPYAHDTGLPRESWVAADAEVCELHRVNCIRYLRYLERF